MTYLRKFPLSIKPMAIYPHLLVAAATRISEDFDEKKKKKTQAHAILNDLLQRGPPRAMDVYWKFDSGSDLHMANSSLTAGS